jgi:L-alanine-DL-glutamate epimerase-like enolase superfamily enzyme
MTASAWYVGSQPTWTSWLSSRKTHVPIATGKRIFTRCGFKGILEKRAATILLRFDPDDGSVVD